MCSWSHVDVFKSSHHSKRLCVAAHPLVLCRVKDHKARNNIASAVIVMSLAGPRSASMNDAIDAASQAGIVMVTAAGA